MKPETPQPSLSLLLALLLAPLGVTAAEPSPDQAGPITELNLVHFSHTDVGFTDHPAVCRELYRRYLDIALDAALDTAKAPPGERFCWTAEATMPMLDWWQAASPARRKLFLKMVHAGQLEVAALPFNNTPFMDAAQWDTMLHWLPEEVWSAVKPTTAVQNDVNGLPRAAALRLLDRGVKRLFTGINEDSGGVPFPRPSAFWWKQPDGRRLFVWLNIGYGSGFDFFEPGEWRRGPVPRAADTTYRPPRAGDILRSDEASLRATHRLCLERLRGIVQNGYRHRSLTISITSQWRFDNDPPFPAMADFVAGWNRLGLQPRLRLTTVSDAMDRLEKELGADAPEYSGEWTDWWANGTASAPREVAASRFAKRFLAAAASPVWGALDTSAHATMNSLYRDLCLFDEHTWGSSLSVAKPFSLDTQSQFNEKAALAFRPMACAEWLLSQRARTRLVGEGEGALLANPAPGPYSGWVRMIATCLREPSKSVLDPKTGLRRPLYMEPGIQPWGRPQKPEDLSPEDVSATFPDNSPNHVAKFWVDRLEPHAWQRLRFDAQPGSPEQPASATAPDLKPDAQGWPQTIAWPGMKQPLFLAGFGDFTAIKVNAFAPRWTLADIRGQSGDARERLRREKLEEIPAVAAGAVSRSESPHTIVLTQSLRHPRLQWATRVVEIWKHEPRVRYTLRLNRISSAAPEIYYVAFPLPTGRTLPRFSSGGLPFIPFQDQLPGTCRDYFAIDGWADYATADGHWLWVSRDAPLVALGSSPTLARLAEPPADPNRLLAMVYNNFWYTNFLADEAGIMEFQFDLMWKASLDRAAGDLAAGLVIDPVLVINPDLKEDPRVMQRLYRP